MLTKIRYLVVFSISFINTYKKLQINSRKIWGHYYSLVVINTILTLNPMDDKPAMSIEEPKESENFILYYVGVFFLQICSSCLKYRSMPLTTIISVATTILVWLTSHTEVTDPRCRLSTPAPGTRTWGTQEWNMLRSGEKLLGLNCTYFLFTREMFSY